MKRFKKLLVLFTFVLLIGALTACSSMNKIAKNFEDAGYNIYEHNYKEGVQLFSDIDIIVSELNITIESTTMTTTTYNDITTTMTGEPATTTTENVLASVLGFNTYAFSNGDDIVGIILEFKNEEKMQEVIAASPHLAGLIAGLDESEYKNGNCILIVDTTASYYDEVVAIFQGTYEVAE